ncbi:citrate/sodium symporter CitS [Clostridium hydrogeniformans]|uniref:citrate/sodium symporter CitS n=1 Tax=Clostridium hydrogeniformans TaxID=349933 RepID=UPI000B2CC090|nr:2-hydroxycarboxylate transporter family protein [Clostridium hydrogeniformans]
MEKEQKQFKIFGMPWYLFAIFAIAVIASSLLNVVSKEITFGFATMFVLGVILGEIGDRIPIWNEYVGGGAILAFIASAYLVYIGVMPKGTTESITFFMEETNFLNLFISVLITGSILSVNKKLLVKALTGYVPAILGGVLGAFALGALGGLLAGVSPIDVAMKYVLPIMGGGTGAGAIPMSEIYKSVTGGDPKEFLSFAFPILTIANIICIIAGALLNKLGERSKGLTGNGTLMRGKGFDAEDKKVNVKITNNEIGAALLMATAFYAIGAVMSKKILPGIGDVKFHTFAYMVLFVSLFNVLDLVPEDIKQASKKLQSFFTAKFLWVIMIGVGVAYTDIGEIIAALTLGNVFIATFIVIGAIIGSGFVGYLVGFYPIETAITAGLCMANRGGSGDIAVLGAAKRMELMSFAQISSRIGGGLMLVIASVVFGMFM